MITIVDYGLGNLGSIKNMFRHIGERAKISSEIKDIESAKKLLLPGVGAFDNAMKKIHSMGIKEILDHKVLKEKVPILGICLGMQLLTKNSEEGDLPGFGWIPANTLKFRFDVKKKLKIPHMGWNDVKISNQSLITTNLPKDSRFYFVHSYYVTVDNEKFSMLKTNYGVEFDSAIMNNNIYGTQFHPEKSHKFGMKIFENFAKI